MDDRRLAASIDGKPLDQTQARQLWERFSSHMDEHQGDFDGFATSEGFVSAHVAVQAGVPTLALSSSTDPPKAKHGRTKKRKRRRRR